MFCDHFLEIFSTNRRGSIKHTKLLVKILIQLKDCSNITASATDSKREKTITIEQIKGRILYANLPVTVVWS